MTNNKTLRSKNVKINKCRNQHLPSIVKIARLANAVAFAFRAAQDGEKEHGGLTSERQMYHGIFLLGGYLFDALTLIDQITPRYNLVKCFAELRELREHTLNDRDVLTEMNLSVAFHLDPFDRSTAATLATVKPEPLEFAANNGHDGAASSLYFRRVFELDTERLITQLASQMTKDELAEYIRHELPRLAIMFLKAARTFTDGMLITMYNYEENC